MMAGDWSAGCKCKGTTNPTKCLVFATLCQIQKERIHVFGGHGEPAPTSKERTATLTRILKDRSNLSSLTPVGRDVAASSSSSSSPVELRVTLLDSSLVVCESAFLVIVGLTSKAEEQKPKKWATCKRNLQMTPEEVAAAKEDKKQHADPRHAPKQEHALSWLHVVGQNSSDFSVNAGEEDKKIIPYGSVPEMWREYKMDSIVVNKVSIVVPDEPER